MKIKYLALALLPLALAACQTSNVSKIKDHAIVNATQQPSPQQTLNDYEWSFQPDGTKKPIVLSFTTLNQNLSINTGCNNMGTSWSTDGSHIIVAKLMSTMKACEPALMQQEKFAASIFATTKVPFSITWPHPHQPVLTLMTAAGEKIVFNGDMTPEARYQSQPETIFLEISPETKQCTGVAPQTCLQVREIKYNNEGMKTQVDKDWTYFYDGIQGFKHEPSERQIVRIKRYEIKNPAADQSKYAYIQDMIIERETLK